MNFKEIMMSLYKVMNDAKAAGLSEKQIQELKIVKRGILNTIDPVEIKADFAKHKLDNYVLIDINFKK